MLSSQHHLHSQLSVKIEYTMRNKRNLQTLKCLWNLSTHITTNCWRMFNTLVN